MTTVQGSKGRKYEVQSRLFGTNHWVYTLFYGGILLASTNKPGPNGESSSSIEVTIERANKKADDLGIETDSFSSI